MTKRVVIELPPVLARCLMRIVDKKLATHREELERRLHWQAVAIRKGMDENLHAERWSKSLPAIADLAGIIRRSIEEAGLDD